ncbi:hypothetical protein ACFC0D_30570 [Streptomyces sp. NPDC056222]|uniref:hypothetical protein n=1 Tax=Streptomyces sp. NPDC056222 TaxID=3345749 RepID=UPI0035D905DB
MDARDVSELHDSMRRYGIPGGLEPVNPECPAGSWRVVDDAGRDITDETLAAVAAAARRRPARGFVTA